MPAPATVDMRRRRDHPPAHGTAARVNINQQVTTTTTTTTLADELDEIKYSKSPDGSQYQSEMNMKKWTRLNEDEDEEHEMNDHKYLQHLARKTCSRRRKWRRTGEAVYGASHNSRWTIIGGPAALGRRTRTKLSKRRFRVRSFIMRKLSTLSQILFMFICLALMGATITTRQPWANCEPHPAVQQQLGVELATNSSSSSSNDQLEIQRSPPRAASGVVDLHATQRRARQQTTRQQLQTRTTTNKVVDSAAAATPQFDIERKPQSGDSRDNNNNNNNNNNTPARTGGNYGEKQQQQQEKLADDLSGLSTIDLNLTNSIEFNRANGGSLSSLAAGSPIVVLDSGWPKYENYPIDPSELTAQTPFAAEESVARSSGSSQSAADDGQLVRDTNDRQRAHESSNAYSNVEQWQQAPTTTTTMDGGMKRNFLNASLEAQAKLKDTVQQLHYNKSLSFERSTTTLVNDASTPVTLLSPQAALVGATHESRSHVVDDRVEHQSNLLPSTAPAGYLLAPESSSQLVSVSPTSAPSQLIEYANNPQAKDPLETAATADEVRQRQHSDLRTAKTSAGTDWGRRKSAARVLANTDNELQSETGEDQTRAASPVSSPYEDIVTWTPAAGPAAYRAGSGFQPPSSALQRADNLTASEELQPANEQTNSIAGPNENFYVPAARYSSAATLNATRRSDGDADSPLVPIAPVVGLNQKSTSAAPVLTKRRHQKLQTLAFKTRAPRVQQPPVASQGSNRSLSPAYANTRGEHFGSDEADSRQSARYSDFAGRERATRPGLSMDASLDDSDQRLDRVDSTSMSSDFDERSQPSPIADRKAKRKKSKRVKVRQQQPLEPEPERNSIDESEPDDDTQLPPDPSRKVESEPIGGDDDQETEPELEAPQVSSTTAKPAQVAGHKKKVTSKQQVAGTSKTARQWKQSANKQSKHVNKEAHLGDRVQWSQLDVSSSSTIKAAAEGGQSARPPIIKTFRLAEPKFQPLAESPPPLPSNSISKPDQLSGATHLTHIRNANQNPYTTPEAFSFGATAGTIEQSQLQQEKSFQRPTTSFNPSLTPISRFQSVDQTRPANLQQEQRQPAYSSASASTNQLMSQELVDQQQQQQQQRQNWSVVVLPYPKPMENAQNYFGSLPLIQRPQQQARPASIPQQQQPFNAVAESAAQHYAAPAPPIVWPTAPANDIGQQLAMLRRQHELMQQQQQQQQQQMQSGASGANKLIQRGTRNVPAEMRAPDNTLTINLNTHAASAVGPNQLFWEAAAREAAAQKQQQQQQHHDQARSDAQKVPVSNGHTPPQHRESRQSVASGSSLPMMRRPLAAMRHHQQHHSHLFGNDQAGSAPGGSVYPSDAYTNGHAYAGSSLKGPQLAAALDSLRSFNEFAHFQQASSNEFAFADPMANTNQFYSFAGPNPFETPAQQQQVAAAATDAFTSLLQQSGYGPSASFFPTNAQASAMAGNTNNNSQFVKKGSAQLIASTPPMATPAGVRDPFGWPLAYGSQAAKSLLQINQVAPAPNYLIPTDKLKEMAATSQQQQKSLRPTIENVQDLPSATSWNPNQLTAGFPLWAAASAPVPVAVRPNGHTGSAPSGPGDLAASASSSGPQNVMRVQISTRAPSRRERFWKRLRLFRRSLAGGTEAANETHSRSEVDDDDDEESDGAYLLRFEREQKEKLEKSLPARHKRSTVRESLREQLAKSTPVVKIREGLRSMRASNKTTPTNKKSPAPSANSWLDLETAESQVNSQVVAPPKLAIIDQDEASAGQTGRASSASSSSGTRTAFIPLLDTTNLIDNLENDLLAQAMLFSQRQHMQRLTTSVASAAAAARPLVARAPPNYTNNNHPLFQQLESAPQAQFMLPAHSMQMVSHTPLYTPNTIGGQKSVMPYEGEDYNQLVSSFQRPDPSQYGMLMQAAASVQHAADGQHLEPPANEPGAVLSTQKDQQASGTGPRARIKQFSSQLMKQSRKPLTKLMQMTNFTSRFQPVAALKSAVSGPQHTSNSTSQMATSASSVRPTTTQQRQPSLPLQLPMPSFNYLLNEPLMMSHYLGAGANGGSGLGPYQEMLMLINQQQQQQQQMAMQPSMTVGRQQQVLFPPSPPPPLASRPPLQASVLFAGHQHHPPQPMGANFNTIYARPRDVDQVAPPRVGATVIAGNRSHSFANPMTAASNEASHLVRFAEVPTSYNHFQQARLFAPANVPRSSGNQFPPAVTTGSGQRAHERADEISQLIGGLKLIKQSFQEKSSELTGGDALRRASGGQFQYAPTPPQHTMQDFRPQHYPTHHMHGHHQVASRRQQVKISPTLRVPQPRQAANLNQQQHRFVHQVSTSPSFKFVSGPAQNQQQRHNVDEQAALLAAAAAASQHEHDFSSYLSNFQSAPNYTDAEIFSSPSDQQPVELQANNAHELTSLTNSGGGEDEQQAGKMSLVEQQAQQQPNMIAIDDPTSLNSLLTGSSKHEEDQQQQQQQQQQLINQQMQQQTAQQSQQSGGNFVSQDEAQFQQQQQNAFLQMQQFGPGGGGGNNVNLPRPRLPKFSIPSINSITNKFRQHLYQAFKLNPMGSGGSSRWPTMLASPASYMSYQQQPSSYMSTFPVQQQQQEQPMQQQVNFRPAGVQLQQQHQQPQVPSASLNMESSASNYYDVTRQPPAHFRSHEFSMGPQQQQQRPLMMQMQQQSQPQAMMSMNSENLVNSNRMPRRQQQMMAGMNQIQPMHQNQQQQQQQMFVSSAPSSIANQVLLMNQNNNKHRPMTMSQQHNPIVTDQYGNLLNQTTEMEVPFGSVQQVVSGEQTISDHEIVGLDMTNGTQSIAQAILMAGGNNLTAASQQELFANQTTLAQDEQQQSNPMQGVLTEMNGNLITSDESYIQEDQLDLANQQQSLHGGGRGSAEQAMQPEGPDANSQTRQPGESRQHENIAIKSQEHHQQMVVAGGGGGDPNQSTRGPEMYEQQQQPMMASNNTNSQEVSSQVDNQPTTIMMLEPSSGQQEQQHQQHQHYELERVNSTSVRPAAGSRLARPTKGRPSFSRPGQRQKQQLQQQQQQQQHREVDYQVIRASSDVSASQQQPTQQQQSYMDMPQIVHFPNGTIDSHRQLRKLHSPLFKHAATRPVHHHQNQLQRHSTTQAAAAAGETANETQSHEAVHETTSTSDRFIVPIDEQEIDPNSIEYHHQNLHHSQDNPEHGSSQQPAQILHGTNQILVSTAGQDHEQHSYGHSMVADNEVEQQLDNQLAGRPLNWQINTSLSDSNDAATPIGRQNASLQYDFKPVELSEEHQQHNSSISLPPHEQFVLIDQPVILTGPQSQPVEHIQYSQVNESQVVASSPKLNDFELNLNSNSSGSPLSGSEQPAVFVSIKPERVLQPTPRTTGATSPSPKSGGSQQQNRKRPLKMPKRAPANLQLVQDQRASESSGTSLRTNRPPGMILPNATTTTTSTTTTTTTTSSTTLRPSQAQAQVQTQHRRTNDTRNHNYKSATPTSSLKDSSYTRAPKARIRWQGAHHSPTIGGLLNDTNFATMASSNKTNESTNENQAAWIINGMTHQAYSSPRPHNDSTQESSVTISQVPLSSSSSSSSSSGSSHLSTVAPNHNYGNQTHKLTGPGGGQLVTPTSRVPMPANHRAISSAETSEGLSKSRGSDSRTGSTSFKLSSGGNGSGSSSLHSAPLETGPSTSPKPSQPPRVNQLIDDSFLLASATESSQVAPDQMLAAAASVVANTTLVPPSPRLDQAAADTQQQQQPAIVRRSEPSAGEAAAATSNQTTLSADQREPPQTYDDAETFHAGDWERELATARSSEGEPRIASLAAASGRLSGLLSAQLPLAVRIRMRQQQHRGLAQEDQDGLEATRLLSQSSDETGGMSSLDSHDDDDGDLDELRMKHADR